VADGHGWLRCHRGEERRRRGGEGKRGRFLAAALSLCLSAALALARMRGSRRRSRSWTARARVQVTGAGRRGGGSLGAEQKGGRRERHALSLSLPSLSANDQRAKGFRARGAPASPPLSRARQLRSTHARRARLQSGASARPRTRPGWRGQVSKERAGATALFCCAHHQKQRGQTARGAARSRCRAPSYRASRAAGPCDRPLDVAVVVIRPRRPWRTRSRGVSFSL